MKRLLSLLMCYVFLQAETFALRGGPGGTGNSQLLGSYSAILLQTSPLFDLSGRQVGTEPGNGLGLVTITVPSVGPAVGNFLLFDSQSSDSFLGRINGLSNPATGQLICLVTGSQFKITSTSVSSGTTGAATTTETVSGRLVASKTKSTRSSFSGISGSATLTVAAIPFIDLTTGRTYIANGAPTTYDVVGYLTDTSGALAATFDLSGSNN